MIVKYQKNRYNILNRKFVFIFETIFNVYINAELGKYDMKNIQRPQASVRRKKSIQIRKLKRDVTNYLDLLLSLTKVQTGNEYRSQEMVNVQKLPYKIPAVYSLDMEMGILCLMKERIDIISQNMCRTDVEAISSDWKNVGGDINNAICRCRGCYVEKNGR